MSETASFAQSIESSQEMRLLRQQNIPFVAEVVGRAFTGSAMVEIEELTLLRIISQVREILTSTGYDLPQTPEKYLSDWIRPQTGEAWFSTRLDDYNERLIILRPAGRKVIGFIEMLGVSSSRLTESALSSLGSFVTESAARLTGDSNSYVSMLQRQITEIQTKIASIKANGIAPAAEVEKQDMAARLASEISGMINGFAQIPSEIRAMAQENEEFIQSSDAPIVERFSEILDRRQAYRQSAQYRTLEALHEIHVSSSEKARFQNSIEMLVEACREHLSKEDIKRARTLFPALTRIATKVIEEHASLSRRFEQIFKDPDFAKRHEEARVLKSTRDLMLMVRKHAGPTLRDARLGEVGLSIPNWPVPALQVHDVRFARPIFVASSHFEMAPLPDFDDFEQSLDKTAGEVGKGEFLGREAVIERIESVRRLKPNPSLKDVLEAYPPNYGTEELAVYFWIAGSEVPSRFTPGDQLDAVIKANGRDVLIRCPNPCFPETGSPGEGLEDYLRVTKFLGIDELIKNIPWDGPRTHFSLTEQPMAAVVEIKEKS